MVHDDDFSSLRRRCYTLEAVWSCSECRWILDELHSEVRRREGWTQARHAAYATTDIPCAEAYGRRGGYIWVI